MELSNVYGHYSLCESKGREKERERERGILGRKENKKKKKKEMLLNGQILAGVLDERGKRKEKEGSVVFMVSIL